MAQTPEERKDAWLLGRVGRTHEVVDGRHVLKDPGGILMASNRDLGRAVDTAIRRGRPAARAHR